MSDFIENEASESDEDEVASKSSDNKSTKSSEDSSSDSGNDDDEEEDEEDEGNEAAANELKDLINDDDEEEGDEEGKRKHESSESDDVSEVEEDDLELIEENLGIKLRRNKKQRKRVRVMSSDEESEAESDKEKTDRERIEKQLFDDDDREMEGEQQEEDDRRRREKSDKIESLEHEVDEEEEEESDEDDFIVDAPKVRKKRPLYDDAALQEAQDIFGVDFDYGDFAPAVGSTAGDEDVDELDEDEEGAGEERHEAVAPDRRRTIYEVFEPSELEEGHLTEADERIRTTDMPERFQTRPVPVEPLEDGEDEEEAEWIYKQCFLNLPISMQDLDEESFSAAYRKPTSTVGKIKDALNFMRNASQYLEVPFIAFYRKEYVEPELNINDLWRVWKWDSKWSQLRRRKQALHRLLRRMQHHQGEQLASLEASQADEIRTIEEKDVDRVHLIQSVEELKDVYQMFLLYYGREMTQMRVIEKKKRSMERAAIAAEDGQGVAAEGEEGEEGTSENLKQASRRHPYTVCVDAKLAGFAKKFGLSPEQFGESLRETYQKHEVEQFPVAPLTLAEEYLSPRFPTSEEALRAARFMVALQLAREPLVRQVMRRQIFDRARITVRPTRRGRKEIDESHPCFAMKYMREKPCKDLQMDQFLRLHLAEREGLLELSVVADIAVLTQEITPLYQRDEFSQLVQEWNRQRALIIEQMLKVFLIPEITKELRCKLLGEAQEHVIKQCTRRLYGWLSVHPYFVKSTSASGKETKQGVRIMGITYDPGEYTAPSYAAIVDPDGELIAHIQTPSALSRRPDDVRQWREQIREFIGDHEPGLIVIGGESRDATTVHKVVQDVLAQMNDSGSSVAEKITVEIGDNELAKVVAQSKRASQEWAEHPLLLREAISLARRFQDPLIEFSQLCNSDDELLCLSFHQLQSQLDRDDLLEALIVEFVNRTNEVGVDVNRCVAKPHTANLLQFVCGIGPRKAQYLLRRLRQSGTRLENRTSQLIKLGNLGPRVYVNCAGFLKIDTAAIAESSEIYVEVLDGSRVHPEAYEWARKMAEDALDYEEEEGEANPAQALEEILEQPERLKDLDLDAFAIELQRTGFGNKKATLYDIRAELYERYRDLRLPYKSPSFEELFFMLTKETPATFFEGKLVECRVIGIAFRRPKSEQLDQANPERDDASGLWKCPFCKSSSFKEMAEVWSHFDSGECEGEPVGVKVRLDNGCSGFIPTRLLSDQPVSDPNTRVKNGMVLHARIRRLFPDNFNVEVTCRTSDLKDVENKFRPPKDTHYDHKAETADNQKDESAMKKQQRNRYVKRVISHHAFKNVDYAEAERLLVKMDVGEALIRPSSKGPDHLTLSWKFYEGVLMHVDIHEQNKSNAFSLGKTLVIQNEEYEDLDEIMARYVQPMSSLVRDVLSHKCFQEANLGDRPFIEGVVREEKKRNPSRIPYVMSPAKTFPGKFMLSYLPRSSVVHEFFTVTPEGLRYRSQVHRSLNAMLNWFKKHYRERPPMPAAAASFTTPGSHMSTQRTTPMSTVTTTPGMSGTPRIQMYQTTPTLGTPSGAWAASQAAAYRTAGATYPYGYPNTITTPMGFSMTPVPVATPQIPSTPAQTTPMYPPTTPVTTPQIRTPSSMVKRLPPKPVPAAADDWAQKAREWAASNRTPTNRTPTNRGRPRNTGKSPGPSSHTPVTDDPWG